MPPRKPKSAAGRKPRAGKAATAQLLIRLTDAEAKRLRSLAGKEPLSAWARAKLLTEVSQTVSQTGRRFGGQAGGSMDDGSADSSRKHAG